MNEDLIRWSRDGTADLSLPVGGQPDRGWAERALRFFRVLCESAVPNHWAIVAAAGDSSASYDQMRKRTLHKLLKRPAAPGLAGRFDEARHLRNAGAHDFTLEDGRVCSSEGSRSWSTEEIIEAADRLVRGLGVLSLAKAIGAGGAQRAVGNGVRPGSVGLRHLETLFASWMEWTDVEAADDGGTITVTARAAGPIRFGNLIHASGLCRMAGGSGTLVCRIDLDIGGGRIEIHAVSPPTDNEQAISEAADRFTIDGEPLFGAYGGLNRLLSDPRFCDVPTELLDRSATLSTSLASHWSTSFSTLTAHP